MCIHTAQADLLFFHVPFDLGLAKLEHSPELLDGGFGVEQLPDLLQREAEVSKGNKAVEATQLRHLVTPIAGPWMDEVGLEQADLVVMAKHPGRDLPDSCELSDVQHDESNS